MTEKCMCLYCSVINNKKDKQCYVTFTFRDGRHSFEKIKTCLLSSKSVQSSVGQNQKPRCVELRSNEVVALFPAALCWRNKANHLHTGPHCYNREARCLCCFWSRLLLLFFFGRGGGSSRPSTCLSPSAPAACNKSRRLNVAMAQRHGSELHLRSWESRKTLCTQISHISAIGLSQHFQVTVPSTG